VNDESRAILQADPRTPPAVITFLQTIDKYSELNTFCSRYASIPLDYDSRFRCEYKQTGVQSAPGRLSSAATLWGSGSNLQNQTERSHRWFIADPGFEFSYVDGAQAEARIVAVVGGVRALLDNFAAAGGGLDVHRANAARIFGLPYDQIPKEDWDENGKPTLRYIGKRCVHGLNYRLMPDGLAVSCNIPIYQATQAWHAYHRAFPEIKQWWGKTIARFKRDRMLTTAFGRRLIKLGPWREDNTTEMDAIIAFEPQSTVGDWVASLAYKCHSHPMWPRDARICLNVHDAIIALNRIADGPKVRAIMKFYGEQTIHTAQGDVVIPFEPKKSQPDERGIHRWSNLAKTEDWREWERKILPHIPVPSAKHISRSA
jgi:hypothetical protein